MHPDAEQQAPPPKARVPAAPADPNAFQHQDHLLAILFAHAKTHPQIIATVSLDAADFTGELREAVAAHLLSEAPLLQSDAIRVKIGELELIAQAKYPRFTDGLQSDITILQKEKRINNRCVRLSKKVIPKDAASAPQ
jgi:hypothetical protein